MDKWFRVYEDEIALFGQKEIQFSFPEGRYSIVVDETNQDMISVEYDGNKEHWSIELKEKKDGYFRLSGLSNEIPELMIDHYWFELSIGCETATTYWGDRVIYRIDSAQNE
ncbi:hypothetical protein [Kiloniella sp.]|uniref:hypothetical protein n=1 Tax=Kiloniella sp. TaxID=1938587 RepID=UPI003B02CA84